jgi:hypothetical protein
MIRTMASDVSALSDIVANGHQFIHPVSSAPSKIPYGGFSPVRLQAGCQRRPSPPLGDFDALTVDISSVRVLLRSRTCVRRHSRPLTPHTRPVALGSASGCSVRRPHGLLWPHPSFCLPPPVSFLCRRPFDGQKFPNLLRLSLIPCRRLYSGGSRALPRNRAAGLAFAHPVGTRQPHFPRTPDYVRACLTKRQHSLNAAARNLA